jgi:hypothetical protein
VRLNPLKEIVPEVTEKAGQGTRGIVQQDTFPIQERLDFSRHPAMPMVISFNSGDMGTRGGNKTFHLRLISTFPFRESILRVGIIPLTGGTFRGGSSRRRTVIISSIIPRRRGIRIITLTVLVP